VTDAVANSPPATNAKASNPGRKREKGRRIATPVRVERRCQWVQRREPVAGRSHARPLRQALCEPIDLARPIQMTREAPQARARQRAVTTKAPVLGCLALESKFATVDGSELQAIATMPLCD
jgi:hypothetical protein